MKIKLMVVVLVACASVAFATAQTAPAPGHPGMHKPGMGKLMKELNLTPAQKSEIKAIQMKSRSKMQALRANTTLPAAQKKAEMKKIHKASMDATMKVLTPAQRAKLKVLRQQMKSKKTP